MKQFLHERTFVHIGFVRKTHGYKGEVKLALEDIFEEDVNEANFVFIDIDGLKVPFRIQEFNETKADVVKFDKVDSIEDSEKISGKQIYLLEDTIKHASEAIKSGLAGNVLIGFTILDTNSSETFKVEDILEYPQQVMALIHRGDKELLIPLNDQLIIEVDKSQKVITMQLPEGLLDL